MIMPLRYKNHITRLNVIYLIIYNILCASLCEIIKLVTSMTVFGTIGLFVKHIEAERGFIAFVRGVVGALFLILLLALMRKRISLEAIRKNALLLVLSGAAIGINWILLFESYSYTTIATSTLCYYMAPVFVILASPIFLSEKITLKKSLCVATALVGMLFVSGVLDGGSGNVDIVGILLALGAAAFYATVTILNKRMKNIEAYDMTIVQLAVAALTVLPYTLIAEENDLGTLGVPAIVMLLVVGVVHTGISYAFYFSSVKDLEAQTVAIFSYLDPIVAVAISLFIGEDMTLLAGVGAALVILSLLISEIDFSKIRRK